MRCACLAVLALWACDDGGAEVEAPDLDLDAAILDAEVDAIVDACPQCPDKRRLNVADFGPPMERDVGPDVGLRPVDDGCSEIYSQELLPRFYVEIDEVEWAAIQEEFRTPREREAAGLPLKPYHPVRAFRYEDEVRDDVMIRLKGNPHFSWVPPKMQFVINFRKVNRDQRFHGVRKLNLDAPWYDRTLIRERVAASFAREAGLAAICANNAELYVNGQYYGLYVNKEHIDKEFLERNFDDPEGNLYKYGFELKTNESEGQVAGRDALWATDTIEDFAALVDEEQVIKEWAAEAMLPHHDGYWCCNHNYYVYEQPGRGFAFVIHDLDITFDSEPLGGSRPQLGLFYPPRPPKHFGLAMAQQSWRDRFAVAVGEMLPAYDPAELERRVEAWSRQTHDAYLQDPNLPFDVEERTGALQALRGYFGPRREHLDRFSARALACSRGEPAGDRDGDGVDGCEDCDDLNMQVKPGVVDSCNERDDDCDGRVDEDEECADCVPLEVEGGRYALCAAPQAWFDGHGTCQRQGGAYAVPVEAPVREALARAAAPLLEGPWWIGANDGGSEERWVDPEARVIEMPPFAEGQPNGLRDQNCATLDPAQDGLWTDEDCLARLPVICTLP